MNKRTRDQAARTLARLEAERATLAAERSRLEERMHDLRQRRSILQDSVYRLDDAIGALTALGKPGGSYHNFHYTDLEEDDNAPYTEDDDD